MMIPTENKKKAGILGVLSVLLFAIALIIFGNLNAEFSFFHDFISKLGAKGEPNALGWNIIGFGLVGITLFGFGILYGKILNDRLAGILLALFGVGFALISIPIDMAQSDTPVSKAHIVAVCLALACWLFGLARISYYEQTRKRIRSRANWTAGLIILSMVGFTVELWSMPTTHRLVFAVVFGWTGITALELLLNDHQSDRPVPWHP